MADPIGADRVGGAGELSSNAANPANPARAGPVTSGRDGCVRRP